MVCNLNVKILNCYDDSIIIEPVAYIQSFENLYIAAIQRTEYNSLANRNRNIHELILEHVNVMLVEFNAIYSSDRGCIEFKSKNDAIDFLLKWS